MSRTVLCDMLSICGLKSLAIFAWCEGIDRYLGDNQLQACSNYLLIDSNDAEHVNLDLLN
jgi:hypothetical protein